MSNGKDLQLLSRLSAVLMVPAVLVAGPVLGVLLGDAVDRRWQSAPWGLLVGAAVGGLGSCIEVYRILRWIATLDRNRTGKS